MNLKYKSSSSSPHPGYGAGSGDVETTVFYCPCGEGEVTKTRDAIPGFRTTDWFIHCEKCSSEYKIENEELVKC